MWRKKREPWKGLVAGLAGGLVASWTMDEFQAAWIKVSQKLKSRDGQQLQQQQQQQSQSQAESEPPLEKVAGHVSKIVLHRELSLDEKKKLAPVVHYAFGAAMGGLYGALAEVVPAARTGFGTAYGALVFVGVDEAGLTALGLAKKPTEYPLSTHVNALASHLVYGATTEGIRRLVCRAL